MAMPPPAVENGLSLTEFAKAKHETHGQQAQAGMFRLNGKRGSPPASRCFIANSTIDGHGRHFFDAESLGAKLTSLLGMVGTSSMLSPWVQN